MEKEILLKNATRNELIEELKSRASITTIENLESEGTSICHARAYIAITDKSWIFVIRPNEENNKGEKV